MTSLVIKCYTLFSLGCRKRFPFVDMSILENYKRPSINMRLQVEHVTGPSVALESKVHTYLYKKMKAGTTT